MKADAVRALIQAHYQNDHDRFRSMALIIAAHEHAKSPKFAAQIKSIVDGAPRLLSLPIAKEAEGLFAHSQPTTTLGDMVLDVRVLAEVSRVLEEQRAALDLRCAGLQPARKLLLAGPPGVGKTMLARAIAGELKLPMLQVHQHRIVEQYLGATSAKLAKVFETMRVVRAVYLFDEFDSLAHSRTSKNEDVGEMVRVVNSLLQFIENDEGDAILVAATNARGAIDHAMFRRFDAVLELTMPTQEQVRSLVLHRLLGRLREDGEHSLHDVVLGAYDLSFADIAWCCDRALKTAVLRAGPGNEPGPVTTEDLYAEFRERRKGRE